MSQTNQLTIVMYHYVRELQYSRFPDIKGLSIEKFKQQLDYFARYYTFVRMEDCIESLSTQKALPQNAILLTFDDGYMDHFLNVFPILQERKIQGSFFPSAKAVLEQSVLDVNKIHFVLAAVDNKKELLQTICQLIECYRAEYDLKSPEDYLADIHVESRYDSQEVIYIKCLLQRDLPLAVREQIVRALFDQYVQLDESIFARELYMNLDQIKLMKRSGMYIGSHSYNHVWLDSLNTLEQENEINRSLDFLDLIQGNRQNWAMCYPYGIYNESLIALLKKYQCKLGLTTHVNISTLNEANRFILPRLDTNDFPCSSLVAPCKWTTAILPRYEYKV